MKRIRTTEPTLRSIQDTGKSLPRIEPHAVETALGGEVYAERLIKPMAPITLFAVREQLVRRLQSTGGRPGLSGIERRVKIPLGDQEWMELEELAASISSPGFAPSAGQVASVLLKLSVRAAASQVDGAAERAPGD